MNANQRFRRSVARTGALAITFCCLASAVTASAQDAAWPTRNVAVIVPLGAGSASDIIARVVMEQVGRQLGQTFVVENRPGAGGTIGANAVARSTPDGYTILAYGAMASANALYSRLPYDTLRDFVPVIPLGQQPLVLVTAPAKGYRTLKDLVAAAKAKPGELSFTTAGIGSASHFGAKRIRASAGFDALHIPFKGAAEAVTEVVAGRADFSVQLFATTLGLIRQGQLVALAVSAPRRTAAAPEVPTTIEAGLPPNSVYPFYSALYLPAKTPRAVVDKLHGETAKALAMPAVRERLATLGVEPMEMSLAEFDAFFREDVDANMALVKAAKIPMQ
jgi:tripartite-type tricarboxylate transporter receptor subunit TctC